MKKLRTITYILSSVAVTLFSPLTAHASLSPADYVGQGIDHYDTREVCGGGGSGTLAGADNIEKALNFMIQNGFSLAGAAGVIGNWQQESGVQPDIIQGGATASPDYMMVPGVGFGLAQWTPSSRQSALAAFAQSKGLPITDLSVQLEFFLKEFSESYPDSYAAVVGATDPVQAAVDFHNGYEGSADSDAFVRDTRGGNAQKVFDQYKGTLGSATSSTVASGGGTCTAAQPAGNVVYYSQLDSQWSGLEYAGSTIAVAGCGPTSMAMILATLVDKSITPKEVAAATTSGQSGGTSSHGNFIAAVTATWPVTITGTMSLDDAMAFVQSGKGLVWMGGQGAPPFTQNGHLVAMVGVTSDGKITIADPVGDGNDSQGQLHAKIKDYTKAEIQAGMQSAYGVSKQ